MQEHPAPLEPSLYPWLVGTALLFELAWAIGCLQLLAESRAEPEIVASFTMTLEDLELPEPGLEEGALAADPGTRRLQAPERGPAWDALQRAAQGGALPWPLLEDALLEAAAGELVSEQPGLPTWEPERVQSELLPWMDAALAERSPGTSPPEALAALKERLYGSRELVYERDASSLAHLVEGRLQCHSASVALVWGALRGGLAEEQAGDWVLVKSPGHLRPGWLEGESLSVTEATVTAPELLQGQLSELEEETLQVLSAPHALAAMILQEETPAWILERELIWSSEAALEHLASSESPAMPARMEPPSPESQALSVTEELTEGVTLAVSEGFEEIEQGWKSFQRELQDEEPMAALGKSLGLVLVAPGAVPLALSSLASWESPSPASPRPSLGSLRVPLEDARRSGEPTRSALELSLGTIQVPPGTVPLGRLSAADWSAPALGPRHPVLYGPPALGAQRQPPPQREAPGGPIPADPDFDPEELLAELFFRPDPVDAILHQEGRDYMEGWQEATERLRSEPRMERYGAHPDFTELPQVYLYGWAHELPVGLYDPEIYGLRSERAPDAERAIHHAIIERSESLYACYAASLERGTLPSGDVVLRLVHDGGARPSRVWLSDRSHGLDDQILLSCLEEAARHVELPSLKSPAIEELSSGGAVHYRIALSWNTGRLAIDRESLHLPLIQGEAPQPERLISYILGMPGDLANQWQRSNLWLPQLSADQEDLSQRFEGVWDLQLLPQAKRSL